MVQQLIDVPLELRARPRLLPAPARRDESTEGKVGVGQQTLRPVQASVRVMRSRWEPYFLASEGLTPCTRRSSAWLVGRS